MGVLYTSFESIKNEVDEALQYLCDHDLEVNPITVLGNMVQEGLNLIESWRSNDYPQNYDYHQGVENLANLHAICRIVLRSRNTRFEKLLLSRLQNVLKGDPRMLSKGKHSQERDILFEVLCAYVCSQFASSVEFEEPDIRCTFQDNNWGLACKVAYGSPERFTKAIRKGEKQIEKSKSDLGLIIVQLTNKFPHDKMYWRDTKKGQIISSQNENTQRQLFKRLLRNTVKPFSNAYRDDIATNPRDWNYKVRGVLYAVHTIAYFQKRRCIMSGCYFSKYSRLNGTPESYFINLFNEKWQQV